MRLYGAAYAKYKARVLSENPDLADSNNLIHCNKVKDMDEESVEGKYHSSTIKSMKNCGCPERLDQQYS